MQIVRVVFSVTLHFRLSDDYNSLYQDTFQGNIQTYIYIMVITYICHKKRGHLQLTDHKREDISAKRKFKRGHKDFTTPNLREWQPYFNAGTIHHHNS